MIYRQKLSATIIIVACMQGQFPNQANYENFSPTSPFTQTHRQRDRQRDRQTERQTDRKTDRQKDRHTHTQNPLPKMVTPIGCPNQISCHLTICGKFGKDITGLYIALCNRAYIQQVFSF